MKLSRTDRSGFTLIEILITLTIVTIITIVSFLNVRTLREDQELQAVTDDLKSHLRLVYTNATANVQCPNGNKSTSWEAEFSRSGTNPETLNIYCNYVDSSGNANKYLTKTLTFNKAKLATISTPAGCTTDLVNIKTVLTFKLLTGSIIREFLDQSGNSLSPSGCSPLLFNKQDQFNINLTKTINNVESSKTVSINQSGSISEQ